MSLSVGVGGVLPIGGGGVLPIGGGGVGRSTGGGGDGRSTGGGGVLPIGGGGGGVNPPVRAGGGRIVPFDDGGGRDIPFEGGGLPVGVREGVDALVGVDGIRGTPPPIFIPPLPFSATVIGELRSFFSPSGTLFNFFPF